MRLPADDVEEGFKALSECAAEVERRAVIVPEQGRRSVIGNGRLSKIRDGTHLATLEDTTKGSGLAISGPKLSVWPRSGCMDLCLPATAACDSTTQTRCTSQDSRAGGG